MRFNKAKHTWIGTVPHICTDWEKNSLSAALLKDMGILVDENLDRSQQHALAARNSNCIMGCIKKGDQQGEGGDCPLLLCPRESHLEYCVQAWGHQHKKDVEFLEWVQR